jgi:hypothetical protein
MSEMNQEEPEKKDVEDSYKSFRTGLVILWLLCNIVLIVFVTTDDFITLGVSVSLPHFHLSNSTNNLAESRRRANAHVLPIPPLRNSCTVHHPLRRFPLVHWPNRHHVLHREKIERYMHAPVNVSMNFLLLSFGVKLGKLHCTQEILF